MAITKTNFINYSRCPRYVALDDVKKNKLDSTISLEEYLKEEEDEYLSSLLSEMYDEDDNDLIDVEDKQLKIMMPYYNEVEILSGDNASKYFTGSFKYSRQTAEQESFDAKINGIMYLCYVDILNETKEAFNIIEVKATTSKTFLKVGSKIDGEYISIFRKKEDGIYYLDEEFNDPIFDEKNYLINKKKLYDRYNKAGHYVYDLAVQRYIIENDLKQSGREKLIPKIKYYLSCLNCEYVYDGKIEKGENVYSKDVNGNDIVSYFDFTSVTKDMMDIVDIDRQRVEKYIKELNAREVPIDIYCENKKRTCCKYKKICWQYIPDKNSIFNYLDSHYGFKDSNGNKYSVYELANSNIVKMEDLSDDLIDKEKNIIQKKVVISGDTYYNIEKIRAGINQITYPLYHLDFETFPCPLPRLKGEKCYDQSVFQFSLHIERKPNMCDKEKDHYGFLAKDTDDEREELIKEMLKYIDVDGGGTILVYNASFEKTRLKELANIFPKYKNELLKMRSMVFDLLDIIKTNSSLYEELGFDSKEAKLFNYYHKDMSGSFSIKKILPLFSNLTYKGMEVANGVDAMATYASFPKLDQADYEHKYKKLVEYCKQDTWAMVEILWGLRKMCTQFTQK